AAGNDILGVDFKRGDNGMGQVIISLGNTGLSANVSQTGGNLAVEFANASVAREQQARLDVSDFATPVRSVSLYAEDGSAIVLVEIGDDYEYLAYQSGSEYIVNVLTEAESAAANAASGATL